MDSSPLPLLTSTAFTLILLTLLGASTVAARASSSPGTCYRSIISFGDSLTDTGNLLRLTPAKKHLHYFLPPYGETYFHYPTGRCSNGRLVIDFIAESLGLPPIPPYLAGEKLQKYNSDGFKGVNFAVAGAAALDESFFRERGIYSPVTTNSLGIQLGWFKHMLPSLCNNSSDCSEILQSTLVIVGEIGGNDYNGAFSQGKKIEEVKTFVAPVVRKIGSAVKELIELGSVTLMVPGNYPIGCTASYLTSFQSPNKDDYDVAGCLKWLNDFAEHHNKLLQEELDAIRELHPHATIIYADNYNAALRFYLFPEKYGFERTLSACCGGGGLYNYNSSVPCGVEPSTCCDDLSLYICWDGIHWTEAAYKLVAQGLIQGPYSIPPIDPMCVLPLTVTSTEFLLPRLLRNPPKLAGQSGRDWWE